MSSTTCFCRDMTSCILFQNYGCALQMGGNDQWGNMLAGTELIRKVEAKDAQALPFP